MLNRIPKFIRNPYLIGGLFFLVWMVFFDPNDFISQYRMRQKLKDLESEKKYFEEKIIEVEEERQALLSDNKKLEKFARENYLMRKPSEDVFVIVEEKK